MVEAKAVTCAICTKATSKYTCKSCGTPICGRCRSRKPLGFCRNCKDKEVPKKVPKIPVTKKVPKRPIKVKKIPKTVTKVEEAKEISPIENANDLLKTAEDYHHKGDLDKALDYYQQSLELYEEAGSKEDIAKTLNMMGIVFRLKKDLKKSLEYLRRAGDLRKEIGKQHN